MTSPPPKNERQRRRALIDPPRRRRDRLGRTIVLGALVVAAALAWLVRELGLDVAELLGFLLASLGLVALAIAAALLVWLASLGLRRLRSGAGAPRDGRAEDDPPPRP